MLADAENWDGLRAAMRGADAETYVRTHMYPNEVARVTIFVMALSAKKSRGVHDVNLETHRTSLQDPAVCCRIW